MARTYWLAVWVGVSSLSLGCGDDAGAPSPRHEDVGADAAAHDADRDDHHDHAELKALLSDWIHEWDRQMTTQCACLVESGAYKTQAECFDYLRAGASWLSCVSTVLADRDSPETRHKGECLVEQQQMRNACLDATECGSEARGDCSTIQVECAAIDPALTVLVSEQCPDTAILPRL